MFWMKFEVDLDCALLENYEVKFFHDLLKILSSCTSAFQQEIKAIKQHRQQL